MKIVISSNPYRDKQFSCAKKAAQMLSACGVDVAVCLPFDVDRGFEIPDDICFKDLETEMEQADLLVCFGGDGTILHSSKTAIQHDIPVLGVNIGTMGFIAELEAAEIELLKKLPLGEYSIEERSLIDVEVRNGSTVLYHDIALNDAVITKGAIARVLKLDIWCDGIHASAFSGDGVILCTPTGSTAYSMSAGGPIIEPSARNILITPICAHDMLAKSMVVAPSRIITVKAGKMGRHNAFLSVDGGRAFRLNPGDEVIVRDSEKVTKLVRLKDTSFFEILNHKFLDKQR